MHCTRVPLKVSGPDLSSRNTIDCQFSIYRQRCAINCSEKANRTGLVLLIGACAHHALVLDEMASFIPGVSSPVLFASHLPHGALSAADGAGATGGPVFGPEAERALIHVVRRHHVQKRGIDTSGARLRKEWCDGKCLAIIDTVIICQAHWPGLPWQVVLSLSKVNTFNSISNSYLGQLCSYCARFAFAMRPGKETPPS
jgi:hypothetical protein